MLKWFRGDAAPSRPAPDVGHWVREGFAAQQGGDPGTARARYEAALQACPTHADANYLLGTLELRAGRPGVALQRFERAIAADAANGAFHFSRSEALLALGRLDAAAEALTAALARDDTEAAWWNELGRVHESRGQPAAAAEAYAAAAARDPSHAPAWCNLAAVRQRQGDLAGAREALERATGAAPGFAPAWLGLGTVRQAMRDLDGAERCYRQALALHPTLAEALVNLGTVLLERRQHGEAEALQRQALEHAPQLAEAWINLGSSLRAQGRLDEAADAHARAVALAPQHAQARLQYGITLEVRRDLEAAETELHEAIALDPDNPEAHFCLANVLLAARHHDEAEPAYRRALALRPDHVPAWVNYALLLHATGRAPAAVGALDKALEVDPTLPEAHMNRGVALMDMNRVDEAEAALKRALELEGGLAAAHVALASLYFTQGRQQDAEEAARAAIALVPEHAGAWLNLGNALQQQGRMAESVEATRRSIALAPAVGQAWSNLLLTLNYMAEPTAQQLAAEHRAFGDAFPQVPGRSFEGHDRTPGRRLRVGYVSPDFRHHVVSFFFEPVLQAHDRDTVEVVCYHNHVQSDEVTRRLKASADLWRDIAPMSDEAVEQLMLDDRLDVVVDLAGHTSRNRLTVLARRVAPVQVTWLGYPNTTGLAAIDWRITDARADPAPDADAHHAERLFRLPEVFLSYRPPPEAPEVAPPPLLERGYPTFGAYNNFAKVSDHVLALWARILGALPEARLVMKTGALRDPAVRQRLLDRFGALGGDASRVTLAGIIPSNREHLASYAGVDVALDAFPYHGTTTTCEALWMGVPVVTLAGDRHASRVGVTLLEAVGAGELVTHGEDAYVDLAVSLARDPARLQRLRQTLRPRMQASALTDPVGFTRHLEAGYRTMWHDWLARC